MDIFLLLLFFGGIFDVFHLVWNNQKSKINLFSQFSNSPEGALRDQGQRKENLIILTEIVVLEFYQSFD